MCTIRLLMNWAWASDQVYLALYFNSSWSIRRHDESSTYKVYKEEDMKNVLGVAPALPLQLVSNGG